MSLREVVGWLLLVAAMCVFWPRAFSDRMTFPAFVVIVALIIGAVWGLA